MTLMPFGKHKGQPLSAVRADRQYCGWLCAQPWFPKKFAHLHRRLAPEPLATDAKVIAWDAIRDRFGRTERRPHARRDHPATITHLSPEADRQVARQHFANASDPQPATTKRQREARHAQA